MDLGPAPLQVRTVRRGEKSLQVRRRVFSLSDDFIPIVQSHSDARPPTRQHTWALHPFAWTKHARDTDSDDREIHRLGGLLRSSLHNSGKVRCKQIWRKDADGYQSVAQFSSQCQCLWV